MTTFNLSMELCQSPFYPKDRERDLLPLMEFKDCSVSDEESWEVSDSTRYEVRKGMYIAMWVLVCCVKGFCSITHQPQSLLFLQQQQHWLLIDWPTGDVEMVRQIFSESELRAGGCCIRTDSYLWEMTVCKYLNLWKGTRGDNEECHEIGGVSSQHLFHQSFFRWGAIAWQHEVIGECVITPTDPFCINMCF